MSDDHNAAPAAEDHAEPRPEAPADAGTMGTGVAIIGFILCFLMGGLVMWGVDQQRLGKGMISGETANADGVAWSDSDSPVPITSKDPMWGKRDAPVTIVEFSDFQCPFCSRVEPTLKQVRDTYGPDKVRIVWKNNPLPAKMHPNAKPAAEAAAGVFAMKGSAAFWKFHDTAFENQRALNEENFEKWAKEAGVTDMAKYKAGLADHTWAKKVDEDLAVGGAAGVSGTPGFMINGVFVNGAQPFEQFKTVIDAELKKATDKIASGTKKDHVYVAMSQENKKNAPAPATPQQPKDDTTTVFKVPVATSPVIGKPTALVTLILFSDFQCPYCSRVEPVLKAMRDKYGDKIRTVWKNFPLPFHKNAEPAAELAAEARVEKGDKGFWEAHDKLFEKQADLGEETLASIAKELGLNGDKVKAAIKDHTYKKTILDVDIALGDDFGVNGTPTVFVNGRRGQASEEGLSKMIDEEITKAQALIAKGTPPTQIYEALIKDGKGAPEPEKKALANLPANDPWRGNAKAKVVINEFSDFQCPYCKRAEPTIAQVLKDYGDKVKFVWHDLPLPMHPDAPLAAEAAREAYAQKGPDGFWKMHDTLFEKQPKIKREDLDSYAKEQGLNMDKWKNALDSLSHKAEIEASTKPANDAQIHGAPAFIINGYFISGAQPYDKFKKLIDRALSEAK